jgi:hypothetical protein
VAKKGLINTQTNMISTFVIVRINNTGSQMFSGLDFDPLALCNLALHRFIPRGLDELPIVAAPSSLIL